MAMVEKEMERRESKNLAEDDLYEFIKQGWHVPEPGTPFKEGKHIVTVCRALEAVEKGLTRRLVINIPPGHMKSLSVSVFYPAWTWIKKPWLRFLCTSYAQNLSNRDSQRCRNLIRSDWYQNNWGHLYGFQSDHNLITEFENTQTGFRIATSTGGTTTGKRGDRIIIDDPISALDALSEAERIKVHRWWDDVIQTRLNDPQTGAIIIIMQRVHEDDLVGYIMQKEGVWKDWDHICLPSEYDPDHKYPFKCSFGLEDWRTKKDEILWDEMYPKHVLDEKKLGMGSYAYAGQFQQIPAPSEGGLIKRAWFQYYRELPSCDYYVWSWDTAVETGQENDYSVGIRFGVTEHGYYVTHLLREKMEYPELKKTVKQMFSAHEASEVLIEKKQSGQQLVQDFKRTTLPVIPVKVGRDKVTRVNIASPTIEAGKLYLPEDEPWVADFINELIMFPNASKDDITDAVSQFIIRMVKKDAIESDIPSPKKIEGNLQEKSQQMHSAKSSRGGYNLGV